jgi:hypothetical protein
MADAERALTIPRLRHDAPGWSRSARAPAGIRWLLLQSGSTEALASFFLSRRASLSFWAFLAGCFSQPFGLLPALVASFSFVASII